MIRDCDDAVQATKEALWEDFFEWYNAALRSYDVSSGKTDGVLVLLTEAHGEREGSFIDVDQLSDLFDQLWDNDAELLYNDKRVACEAFIMWKKSKQQLGV